MATEGGALYDIHNHLLFGVDDGARNTADTEAMLKDAAKNNIKVIVATPHILSKTDMTKYENNFPIASQIASQYGIKLLRGGEYNIHGLPEAPPYTTIGGSPNGAVLVDFRVPVLPAEIQLYIDNIFNAGCTLIIAHPERTFPSSMLNTLERLADSGVSYQITAGSLLGHFGKSAEKMGCLLLEKGLAKLIASDAHDAFQRANCLQKAYEAVTRKYGQEAAIVLQENARKLIEETNASLQAMPIKRKAFNLFNWLKMR